MGVCTLKPMGGEHPLHLPVLSRILVSHMKESWLYYDYLRRWWLLLLVGSTIGAHPRFHLLQPELPSGTIHGGGYGSD